MSRKACGDLNQSLPVQKNIDFAEKRMNEDEYSENYGLISLAKIILLA